MVTMFEKLPMVLVAGAAILIAVQIVQMLNVAGQHGPTFGTLMAMIFGLVVQASQLLALAALVHYAHRIAVNTRTGA